MKYEARRLKKWDDYLTTEEVEVKEALTQAGYICDPDQITMFVPTRILYRVYRNYIAKLQYRFCDGDTPANLNIRQFGAALCRAFGLEVENKVRRRWHGHKSCGYVGIVGPESLPSRDEPGRPPKD